MGPGCNRPNVATKKEGKMPEKLIPCDLYFMRRIVEEWPELMAELGVSEERLAEAATLLRKLERPAV